MRRPKSFVCEVCGVPTRRIPKPGHARRCAACGVAASVENARRLHLEAQLRRQSANLPAINGVGVAGRNQE